MSSTELSVIITGATGMVGEGVLLVCLGDPRLKKVLIINRRTAGYSHPKLEEIIHPDFFDFSAIADKLGGYDACFFCLGVSSLGMKEPEYVRLTHTLTLHVAETLVKQNPGMAFMYVSGAGTDGTEKGRSMWERVKGKTENDLRKLPFSRAYAFRPGFIKPIAGQKYVHQWYKYFNWLYPIGRLFSANAFITVREISLSMIALAAQEQALEVVNGSDMARLAATKVT